MIRRPLLLNRLRPVGTPCLGLLGVESPIAALRVVGEGIRAEVLRTRGAEKGPCQPERLADAAREGLGTTERLDADEGLVPSERLGSYERLGPSERLTGAEAAARIALRALAGQLDGQLVSEVMDGSANLLGDDTLDCDLLRKLREQRDNLLYGDLL